MSRRTNRLRNKYLPHQHYREMDRRLRQVRDGILNGPDSFIPLETRFAASGLYAGTITVKALERQR